MTTFRATAHNKKGYRFQFTFEAVNWMGIDEVAADTLDYIVANDRFHKLYGPWSYRDVEPCK